MAETEAAVAIIRARGPEDSVLLMRRAEREGDSWSGHWSFPGGRRDPSDHDLLHTALRELEEECGIRLTRGALEQEMAPRYARRKAGAYILVTPFLFATDSELATIPDAREAAEAVWIPLRILEDPNRRRLLPVPGLPPEMRFPGVELSGGPLWGFTFRLMSDWLGIGPADEHIGTAGLDAARLVLDFLGEREVTWEGESAQIHGPIHPRAVLERFSQPGKHVEWVNCLEARSDYIRIVGLDFKEYYIRSKDQPLR
jgi:8-oxo-dGTP pyrophosphatase MutT (NUDIX family)